MLDNNLKKELERLALEIRIGAVEEFKARGFGHIGGSLSVADALAVLYGVVMNVDPKNPLWEGRDKLVCSKGHAGPAVYAALARKGFFPYEELKTLNQPGTNLPSHCDRKKTPGIDMTTGSLGQGTSLAVGMALGDRLKGRMGRTYLIVGDGELNEGQVWEAAMFSAAKKVTNLVWLIDNNKKQLDGYTQDILDSGDLRLKFEAFGFDAVSIDGNDLEQLYMTLSKDVQDRPLAVIMDTTKGKGIEEVEETMANHSMAVTDETYDRWLRELKQQLDDIPYAGVRKEGIS
ncbi:transketolase [Lachnospiraceae bacterium]|uniref:transketolase n=1 Tax=Extibacter sp. GGCC_0201 TaxID=2731209 RepID=UPI001AA13E7C|nr:transketolase [Extibacter sp. GGCC_0201]MBO1721888.1 transketolase [Extibacter sp. GGCC_0201]BDF35055.1 transketolase [Lachnospiraceae bacterium]BDF39056.1 transketolase [Lachnospiraceae bacterium]